MSQEPLRLVIGTKNTSTWSLRPWLVMTHFGIRFEEIELRLRQPDTKTRILEHVPSGKVPALKLGGDRIIWDSLAIIEYLAEAYAEHLIWPEHPMARAHARSIAAEMHSGFPALRAELPMDCLARFPETTYSDAAEGDIRRIVGIWVDCLQRYGSAGPFLFGAFTAADAMYAPVVSRFRTYSIPVPDTVAAYMDVVWGLPAMKRWLSACKATANP